MCDGFVCKILLNSVQFCDCSCEKFRGLTFFMDTKYNYIRIFICNRQFHKYSARHGSTDPLDGADKAGGDAGAGVCLTGHPADVEPHRQVELRGGSWRPADNGFLVVQPQNSVTSFTTDDHTSPRRQRQLRRASTRTTSSVASLGGSPPGDTIQG